MPGRVGTLVRAFGLGWALAAVCAVSAAAATLDAAQKAEMARARAQVGFLGADAAALREEAARGAEPSPAFRLGAALAAWLNAADQLDFDIANPMAVGPAHANLAGPEDFFASDCRDEAAAFEHLTAAALALDASPQDVAAAANLPAAGLTARWTARIPGQTKACR